MNNQPMIFNLRDQPVLKKVIKAVWFHSIFLVLVLIGLFIQHKFSLNSNVVAKINKIYIVFLYFLPLMIITAGGTTIGYSSSNNFVYRYGRLKSSLQDFLVVRTLGSFCRDSSTLIYIIIVMGIAMSVAMIGNGLQYFPYFPFVWLIGFFCVSMIIRYIVILKKLYCTCIIINNKGISLPFFSIIKKHIFFIPWSSMTYLEIIGSENKLLRETDEIASWTLEKSVSFVRGIIIHYETNDTYLWFIKKHNKKLCVITDELLDAKNIWRLYNCCNTYINQRKLRLRLSYDHSPLYIYEQNETPKSILALVRARLNRIIDE